MKKAIIKCVVVILIPLMLYALFCSAVYFRREKIYEQHPLSQRGTVWQSEDTKMSFRPDNNWYVLFSAETEHGLIEIEMGMGYPDSDLVFNEIRANKEDIPRTIASGYGNSKSPDKFVVKISSIYTNDPILSTIFEPGEKIVFHRISIPEPVETETVESEVGSPRIRPIKP